MDLDEIRKEIDTIDFGIARLLSRRMELSLSWGGGGDELPPGSDGEAKHYNGLLRHQFQDKIFGEIKTETRHMLEQKPGLMGFQGEHGAFGEVAARKYAPGMVPIPCREFVDVFDGVAQGRLGLGIVPVENSLEGAVTHVNDLLVERSLKIAGEINIPINQCLMAPPDTDYREIKVVYSHPQALAQCRGFLLRNRLEPRPYYDTAGAAKMISRDRPYAAAAIASSLCARLYNLEVIKENVEDNRSNSTRFVVLSPEESPGEGTKCSLVFSTEHKVGTLYSVLQIFAEAAVNLSRIESRPIRNDPGSYAFLLDFMGSDRDPQIQAVMEKAKKQTTSFKYLGCYREVNP
jgi:prephenate dehydratase/chorismate mutase/prephenate dehydratase